MRASVRAKLMCPPELCWRRLGKHRLSETRQVWLPETVTLQCFMQGDLHCCPHAITPVLPMTQGLHVQVLLTNAANYSKGILSEILDFVMGKGMIPADGEVSLCGRRCPTLTNPSPATNHHPVCALAPNPTSSMCISSKPNLQVPSTISLTLRYGRLAGGRLCRPSTGATSRPWSPCLATAWRMAHGCVFLKPLGSAADTAFSSRLAEPKSAEPRMKPRLQSGAEQGPAVAAADPKRYSSTQS